MFQLNTTICFVGIFYITDSLHVLVLIYYLQANTNTFQKPYISFFHPRTGHEGPEGKRYSPTLSLTLALDVGVWSTPRLCRFTPEKFRYPLYRRLGGAQGRSGGVRKISPPPEFDPRTVQPVASRYTDRANSFSTFSNLKIV